MRNFASGSRTCTGIDGVILMGIVQKVLVGADAVVAEALRCASLEIKTRARRPMHPCPYSQLADVDERVRDY